MTEPFEVTVERIALLIASTRICGVTDRKSCIPIASNVMLAADRDSGLILTGTNLDSVVQARIDASSVSGIGRTTVPAHTMHDILRKLPDGSQVKLAVSGEKMTLRCGKATFRLATLPAEDFPEFRQINFVTSFQVSGAALRKMIEETRFAISTDETRYYLNGIYLHVAEANGRGQVLRAVSTDGHRLALSDCSDPSVTSDAVAGMPNVILPRKLVGEVHKLAETADEVDLAISETGVRFTVGGTTIMSKVIDGTYPDYQRVVPERTRRGFQVAAGALASAVGRVATVNQDRSSAVVLSAAGGALTVSSKNANVGDGSDEIDIKAGADISIGFNSTYLRDVLGQFDADQIITVDAESPAHPALVYSDASPDKQFVIMPMRV